MRRTWLAIILVTAAAACGGSSGSGLPPDPCNPLGAGQHCLSPWPSSAFLVDDPTTATGVRLAIPNLAIPTNQDGSSADPTPWNIADGFSPAAPIIVAFPGGVSADGLPPNDNYDGSITAASPTVLLDLTAMQRVPHFAEIDMQASGSPDSQALFIRPAQRLIGGHRYAVAITKMVKAADGGELPISEGYKQLLAGGSPSHPLFKNLRAHFDTLKSGLATAGYDVADLVLAFDFTVASDSFLHADMTSVRDQTVAALDNHTIAFTVGSDAPIGDGSQIQRRITGTLDAPLFLSDNGSTNNGVVIVRGPDGLPAQQGFYQIPFTAVVPACAYTSPTPVPMVIYGHGLMGDSNETADSIQTETAASICMVFVGTDLRGMSTPDVPAVLRALNDLSVSDEVFEKLEQGIANHITLVRAMRTTFATQLFTDSGTATGKSLVDPTQVYYYGLSQGAIFGGAIMAWEPTVTRAVLGVGAANYSLLLERSTDWPQYRLVLSGSYTDPYDDTAAVNLIQMRWDKVEPAGIVDGVLSGSATGVPPKQLLMQMALGDDEVANLATYWEARTLGVPVLGPTPFTPWGLQVVQTPIATGSALLIMDGGAPAVPTTNVPAPATGMHDLTRKQPATWRQMAEFYATGMIVNECAGECLCAQNQCN
jgi:hypothetical protein|nr:hypothetical protein [Kofleriaceae bacterium]